MRVIADASGLPALHGCAFVPTMGALHEGHTTLVRAAAAARDRSPTRPPVVVSIFVNPTQFNDPKDLARYPRTLEADVRACERAGADAVFAPPVEVMYPPAHPVPIPSLPPVATQPGLEDRLRPGHFAGVCQVVKRLFDLTRPASAFFGEKDWQQLRVISAMVEQERMNIRIIGVPTVREPDGLAMSSRNVFLSHEERTRAIALHEALTEARRCPTPEDAEARMTAILRNPGLTIEYAVIRNAATLLPFSPGTPGRAIIAARLGSIRLIDNAPWPA